MGASIAVPAQGMTFEVESTTPDTYLVIGGIKTYANNPNSATVEDETTFASTAVEKSVGLPDYGNRQLDGQWNRSDVGQARMNELYTSQGIGKFRTTYTDGTIRTDEGYVVTTPDSGNANGGGVAGSYTIELTGAPVYS
jgi:hypothetical protein